MKKLFKWLLYVVPICLFLSYHPVIRLGGNETMNFELSVAELWLVVFDIVGLVVLIRKKLLFKECRKWWKWVLFPVWVTISVIWSLNMTRGVLTAGLMWLIVMAIYIVWTLRDILDAEFKVKWWKWFFGSTLIVCVWCEVQCIMDLFGVPQSCTLLCDGCTYRMFGFPHPNGFAIEPQFMGNLLLAPMIAAAWLYINKKQNNKNENGSRFLCSKFLLFCFLITAFTLFLTFSRGAIYAGVVGMCCLSGYAVVRAGKKRRRAIWKRMGVVWGMVVLAFVVTLNVQGLMAEVSPTNDTYMSGVAKVVNHLSLGVIDIRAGENKAVENPVENSERIEENELSDKAVNKEEIVRGEVVAENDATVESGMGEIVENKDDEKKLEAVFDGYVAESTDTRVRLTGAAVKIWVGDVKTALFGVGLGGAGQALYNNGLSPAPKEIVQNEYASLLLETGLVGVVLLAVLIIAVVREVLRMKQGSGMILGLVVAYGVSLVFFSGLPNALQIYLMPVILMVMM